MNVLSLFDGISGAQLALSRANIPYREYYASEIDQYAMNVTRTRFPGTIQIGDVQKIDLKELPKIFLLIGGSPCQGFSIAGKQLNFNDLRSRLFFEYVRFLKELKPEYFLFENVKMKKEYRDVITKYLRVKPILINSNLVSAQNRQRYYWTNIKNIEQPKNKNIFLKDIIKGDCFAYNRGQGVIKSISKGYSLNACHTSLNKNQTQTCVSYNNNIRMLTPIECERLQTFPDNYTYVLQKKLKNGKQKFTSNTQRYKMLGNAFTVDVIAHILRYMEG